MTLIRLISSDLSLIPPAHDLPTSFMAECVTSSVNIELQQLAIGNQPKATSKTFFSPLISVEKR